MLGVATQSLAEEPQAGKQVEQRLDLAGGKAVEYLLYLPGDYTSGEQKSPLMLFLHGRGESDGPLSLVAKWGPPQIVAKGDELPYVLVSPQCPRSESWAQEGQQAALLELLAHITRTYNVDTDRIYLTGLSMGGYGSWRLAADHPDRFAAVAPVCGGGRPEDAQRLTSLPIWVWHGDQDEAVPFSRSVEMVEAIRDAGGEKIRFTTLEGVGHNSWSAAYATPELYDWFNEQAVSKNR
jgi:predicted peptidase